MNQNNKKSDPAVLPHFLHMAIQKVPGAENQFYEVLVRLLIKYTYSWCSRKAGNKVDQEEVIQNCGLTIMNKLRNQPEELMEVRDWSRWLYIMVRNKVFDELRRYREYHDIVFSVENQIDKNNPDSARIIDVLQGIEGSTFDCVNRKICCRRISEMLKTYSNKQKSAYQLYLQGYTQNEISQRVEAKKNTIGTWIFRIKQDLLFYRDELIRE